MAVCDVESGGVECAVVCGDAGTREGLKGGWEGRGDKRARIVGEGRGREEGGGDGGGGFSKTIGREGEKEKGGEEEW